jgi:hypothetical protein
MATFAKKTFNASVYAACRPTYPPELYETIFRYHHTGALPQKGDDKQHRDPKLHVTGRYNLAVDLGCGTGAV